MGKLYRSNNRVIAGVCAGLAESFGFDVKLTRIAAVACVVIGGFGGLAYLLLWILMPVKDNGKSYAERLKERIDNK